MATTTFTFCEETHRYTRADGLIVPSTTQVLKRVGLVSYDQVQADVLERASKRGTDVHLITEFIDTNFADVPESEIDLSPVNPEYLPYVTGWLKFKRECDVKILDCEKRCLGEINAMPFGMTYDRRAVVNGRESILEIKTCAQRADHWGLQLASYDLGIPQCPDQLHRDRFSVQLRPDGQYRLWPYQDEGDYQVFPWALAIAWWQLNHGYKLD